MRRHLRQVPRPLALLLAVVALFGTAWALLVPVWHAPDELSHFSYVQTLGEHGKLPGFANLPAHSTEVEVSGGATNLQPVIFYTIATPEWSASREAEWERIEGTRDRTNGGGSNPASSYPPFYYLYETVAYEAASGTDIITRLGVMRLASMLWLLVNTVGAWLLAAELFRRVTPRLVTAATIGLWPMLGFITASINPDAALYPLWTLALWMGARIAVRGLTLRRGAALGLFVGLAMVTKAATLALLPTVLLLLAWGLLRAWRSDRMAGLTGAAAGVAVMALPTAAWSLYQRSLDRPGYSQVAELGTTGSEGLNVREFLSYLWQFYLPRQDWMTDVAHHVPVISDLPLMNTWIGTTWGVFGWVNVWFPAWVYEIFAAVVALFAVLVLVALARWLFGGRGRARGRGGHPAAALFLAATAFVTLAAIHWTDYRFYDDGQGLFAQGRYLFPVAGVGAVAVAWGLDSLPARVRAHAAGAWIGGLVALQIACLALITVRWYA